MQVTRGVINKFLKVSALVNSFMHFSDHLLHLSVLF